MSNIQQYDIKQNATFAYLKYFGEFFKNNTTEMKNINEFCKNNKSKSEYAAHIKLTKTINELSKIDSFDPHVNYAKLYTKLQQSLETVARNELKSSKRTDVFDAVFIAAYENNNKIHDEIYDKVIKPENLKNKISTTTDNIKHNLKSITRAPNKHLNISHPDNPINAFFSAMLGINYNPLKKNNVPYVDFDAKELNSDDRKCLRMGSQVQGSGEVNPTFKRYLLANANKNNKDKQFNYVYINLLKRPQAFQSPNYKSGFTFLLDKFVRFSEGKKALALENSLNKAEFKTATITLPADGEFFNGGFSMSTGKSTNSLTTKLSDLKEQLFESIRDNKNDFYMTDEVKKALFNDNNKQMKENIERLFLKAVEKIIGKSELNKEISPQQRNAILFQFVKGELSNEIIDKLSPKAYNISCKDAIDRGSTHTLYHHLNKRFEENRPMSQDEFEKHMDSPALIVKYRPLNDNRTLLWNVLKHRIENDPNFATKHVWLNNWIKKNDPSIKHTKAGSFLRSEPILETVQHRHLQQKDLSSNTSNIIETTSSAATTPPATTALPSNQRNHPIINRFNKTKELPDSPLASRPVTKTREKTLEEAPRTQTANEKPAYSRSNYASVNIKSLIAYFESIAQQNGADSSSNKHKTTESNLDTSSKNRKLK